MLQTRPHIKSRQRRWEVLWFRGSSLSVSAPLCSTAGAGDPGDRWEVDFPALLSWSDARRNTRIHTRARTAFRGRGWSCGVRDNCLQAMPQKAGNQKWHTACPRHASHLQKLLGCACQWRSFHAEMRVRRSGPIAFVSISRVRYSRWRCKRNCSWSVSVLNKQISLACFITDV